MGIGLSTRQLMFVSGITGFLFLGRLLNFAALQSGVYLVLGVIAIIIFCWLVYDIMAARRSCAKPEHKRSAQSDVLVEFACLYAAIVVLVVLGGL